MAAKTINDLSALTAAGVASDDQFVLWDTSAAVSKKLAKSEMGTLFGPGGSSGQLQWNSSGSFAGLAASTAATSGTHLLLTAQSATDIPFAVKGAASQTGNLFEARNNSGTILSSVDAYGGIRAGSPTIGAYIGLDSGFLSYAGLWLGSNVVTPSVANYAMLTDGSTTIFNAPGSQTMAFRINNVNAMTVGTTGGILVNGFTSSTVGLTVKGATSQSANLTEWQNSSGTVLLAVTKDGYVGDGTGNLYLNGSGCFVSNSGGMLSTFFALSTTNALYFDATGVQYKSSAQFRWSAGSNYYDTLDLGLARSAAGKLVITDGSTGAGSLVFRDAGNIEAGTSTGTKIGTDTAQKLAFWNASPVVQQVLATGASHTVDDVITLLQTLGLCKQS